MDMGRSVFPLKQLVWLWGSLFRFRIMCLPLRFPQIQMGQFPSNGKMKWVALTWRLAEPSTASTLDLWPEALCIRTGSLQKSTIQCGIS